MNDKMILNIYWPLLSLVHGDVIRTYWVYILHFKTLSIIALHSFISLLLKLLRFYNSTLSLICNPLKTLFVSLDYLCFSFKFPRSDTPVLFEGLNYFFNVRTRKFEAKTQIRLLEWLASLFELRTEPKNVFF